MTGFEFKEANNTFKAIYKKLRKEGKGQVEHKRSIFHCLHPGDVLLPQTQFY
jgi:hypothetical protein